MLVEQHVRDLLRPRADERERRGRVLAQGLEGAQQDRQALALDGQPYEEDPQLALRIGRSRLLVSSPLRRVHGRGCDLGQVHAVGDHVVAPAVEAPHRPGGGLGYGDAHVQAVHAPPAAERDRGDPVS